jgi:hypothetical protein
LIYGQQWNITSALPPTPMILPLKIIEAAKKGGWLPEKHRERVHYRTGGKNPRGKNHSTSGSITTHEIICDPNFWVALGNKLDQDFEDMHSAQGIFVSFDRWPWQENAHRLFQLLLSKDEEGVQLFWAGILADKK